MIWFTSDHHFWHSNILKYCPDRPYKTVEEMNEDLIWQWNSVVSPDDTVYHLGDFSMAFRSVELYTRRLNGTKHLILGNHDFAHPAHKKGKTKETQKVWIQKYLDNGWVSVQLTRGLEISHKSVILCHMPYLDENPTQDLQNGAQRHAKHRIKDEGKIMLCGHVHQTWRTNKTKNGTLMINVGVDVWDMKPVSMDNIKLIIRNMGILDNI